MKKKGDLTDMLVLLITTFILAVGFLIVIYVIPNITSGLNIAGMNNSDTGIRAINSLENFTGVVNYGFMFLFFGLCIGVLITSFFIRTHPIFMFLYIFFLAITILIGFYLGNAYQTVINNDAFASVFDKASFLNLVMSNIVKIMIAVGALSMIIIFAKFSSFGGGGPQF